MFFFIFAYICSQDFSDQVLTVEPTAECFCFHMFSTSLCLRFQALAEALKINSSVTNIDLSLNDIGAEGAKAWCVGWAPLNAAACHDVTFPYFPGIL